MKLTGVLKQLAEISGPAVIRAQGSRFSVSADDALGAKILLWLLNHTREHATVQEISDALDSAKWWLQFFDAVVTDQEKGEEYK